MRLSALTWSPGLVKLIRGKGRELGCRLMGMLASGFLVTWTKSSPERQKVRKKKASASQFPLCSSSSSLCAVRHEGCRGVRLDPHT